jgi:hypothetical protein
MATGQMSVVIQHLRTAMLLQDGAGLIDGQLLEDCINRRAGTTLAAKITDNEASGGDGTVDGDGLGGGVYIASGVVSIVKTTIKDNHASTGSADLFGSFSTTC